MSENEAAYYYRRAEAELEMAQSAQHPAAVRAHYTLASHYLDSLHDASVRDAADPVPL